MSSYLVIVRNKRNKIDYYHNAVIHPEPETIDELGRLALKEMAKMRYVRRELGIMRMRVLDCKFHQLGVFMVRVDNRGNLEIENVSHDPECDPLVAIGRKPLITSD